MTTEQGTPERPVAGAASKQEGQQIVLGVDVGGVIMSKANDNTDTSFFSDNYLNTTTEPFAIETLAKLVTLLDGRVYIVSKCRPKTQQKTLAWMEHHDFFARTGIPREHVHFCLKRSDKAPIVQQLGITHFVDDKGEVLSYLDDDVIKLAFKPDHDELRRFRDTMRRWLIVETWPDLYDIVARWVANRITVFKFS